MQQTNKLNIILPEDLKLCTLTMKNTMDKGEYIYSQGESTDCFYFIKSGIVGLYHTLENGKEALLRLYRENDYFGYRTLFSNDRTYHCSAKVLVPAKIVRINIDNRKNFLHENLQLTENLIYTLSRELQDAENRLSDIAFIKSLNRVFNAINYLCGKYPEYKWTYKEIAEWAGCEVETAIRLSKELKNSGLIKAATRKRS